MFKLNKKFDADSLPYLLSHFESDDHPVHMLIQRLLPLLLTSTMKSSLFTHAHSSPLSLAARLHWCRANCSSCINNGWTFSRQTLYTHSHLEHIHTHTFTYVCTPLHIRPYTHSCSLTHVLTILIHTHTCTYLHTDTHVYTLTLTPTHSPLTHRSHGVLLCT